MDEEEQDVLSSLEEVTNQHGGGNNDVHDDIKHDQTDTTEDRGASQGEEQGSSAIFQAENSPTTNCYESEHQEIAMAIDDDNIDDGESKESTIVMWEAESNVPANHPPALPHIDTVIPPHSSHAQHNKKPNDYIQLSFLACCLNFLCGLIALSFAVKSRKAYQQGDLKEAKKRGICACVFSLISIVGVMAIIIVVVWLYAPMAISNPEEV